MGPGNCGYLMPDDFALLFRARSRCVLGSRTSTLRIESKVLYALRVKMNCAMEVARQPFEQFGEGTLRTVLAVYERRNDGEPQVSASKADETSGLILAQRKRRTWWLARCFKIGKLSTINSALAYDKRRLTKPGQPLQVGASP